jgi:hypothetical protein
VILDKQINKQTNKKNHSKLFRTEQINTLAMSKIRGLCKIIQISFVESSISTYRLLANVFSGIPRA